MEITLKDNKIEAEVATTFGEVPVGSALIMKDDYSRVEVAINMASFAEKYGVKTGDKLTIRKT